MAILTRGAARAILAAHGIEPDEAGGYDLAALEAAVAARGWRWTGDAADRKRGASRHTATVYCPGAAPARSFAAFTFRGNGPTEAAALAYALASALARADRG